MNTLAFSTTTTSTNAFELIPNTIKVGSQRIFLFYTMVLFPLLVVSAIFHNVFELQGISMTIAVLLSLVVFANIYFFYIRSKAKEKHVTLAFEFNELILFQNDQLLNRIHLDSIQFAQLNWGMDKSLPAIQIKGDGFPCLCIGFTQSSLYWKEMETTRDCTDFLVSSEKEWQQLLQLLNNK